MVNYITGINPGREGGPSSFAMCGILFSARLANETDIEGTNVSNYQKLVHQLRQTNGARG